MVGPSLNTPNLTLKPPAGAPTIKFLCSYGGRILPRHPDGKLRYHGGQTRVLSVHRSISFAELLVKLGELCGTSVSLRCQLPTEDLDALVSITSDEDLANLVEEYDRTASPKTALKIRAFLSPPRSVKKISPPPSVAAASPNPGAASPRSIFSLASSSRFPDRCVHQIPKPVVYHQIHHPLCYEKSGGGKFCPYHAHPGNPSNIYFMHNGNHWQ
ncbi:octicosapeptide/Phox/Bem1p (PB1) domain-containing protein [Actinidia rufa]|uniref:Octicosapeptide/Phox/Bem1p (PB1) domain-containing protein n=1 Tax=Actinidia rufa TaxID=165716 RepID=A0A7J0HDY7_9ERIC|nr:octicosapeptide/Phox/Bem1p (PB1) domain-containing protein [Actinidia rufa]